MRLYTGVMSGAMDPSKMPPEVLAQMPAGTAPNGTESNLINPPTAGHAVLAAMSLLLVIMFVFAGLRFYVALKIRRKMAVHDWTTLVAVIGACYYYIVVCLNIVINKFGTHLWDLSAAHMAREEVAIIGFMSNGPPHFIWPVVKSTFFLMYLQLFRPLAWLRRCVYAGLTVVWVWYVGMGIAQIVLTARRPGKTWAESFVTPRYLQTFKLMMPSSSFALISDVYILMLPIIAISHLQLSFAKKFGVAAMFSTGAICCGASSVTLYFQYRIWRNQSDYTYYVVFVYLAYTIEMCVAISTSCMPSLARLHKQNLTRPVTRSDAGSSSFWRSRSRKSPNVSDNSRLSTIEGYPKKSPYTYMEEGSESGRSHEMGHLASSETEVLAPGRTYDPKISARTDIWIRRHS